MDCRSIIRGSIPREPAKICSHCDSGGALPPHATNINLRGYGTVATAPALQAGFRGFESHYFHQHLTEYRVQVTRWFWEPEHVGSSPTTPTIMTNKIQKLKNNKRAPYGTWKCPHCDFIGETRSKLKEHQHKEHPQFCVEGGWNKGLTKETSYIIAKNSQAVKLSMNTEESKEKRSAIQKSLWTEEKRKLRSEEKKKFYSEHPEKHPNRILANNRKKMSYPEKVAFDWLNSNNIQFEHQKQIGKYFVDFFIQSLNSIIEIDGIRWHNKDKDAQRDKEILEHFGIKTIRISTSEKIEDRLSTIFSLRDKVSAT